MRFAVIKYMNYKKTWAIELLPEDDRISGEGKTIIEALRNARYAARLAGRRVPAGFTSAKLKEAPE